MIDKKCDYFSLVNIVDNFSILFSLFVDISFLIHTEMADFSTLRLAASLLTLSLMIKILDFLRVFKVTSFHVQLTITTIKDILPFTIIFIYTLVCFGLPMMFINLEWTHDNANSFWH